MKLASDRLGAFVWATFGRVHQLLNLVHQKHSLNIVFRFDTEKLKLCVFCPEKMFQEVLSLCKLVLRVILNK